MVNDDTGRYAHLLGLCGWGHRSEGRSSVTGGGESVCGERNRMLQGLAIDRLALRPLLFKGSVLRDGIGLAKPLGRR